MKKHFAAAVFSLLALAGCTSQSAIDEACDAHPPKLPDAPVVTDGYFVADYRVRKPALEWISDQLLTRGFTFIETEGRTFPGLGAYLRFSIGKGEEACKHADRVLGKLEQNERLRMSDLLVQKGMKPDQCLVAEPITAPAARYRIEITNHSPPRKPWLDGLSGRNDVRVQTRLRDTEENRALADIWSVTLSYHVTVSGNPVTGCYRQKELHSLQNEFLRPVVAPSSATAVAGKPAAVSALAVERLAKDKLPPINEREVTLKVLAQRPGGEVLDWRVYQQRQGFVAPQMKGVSVSLLKTGWTMRLAVKNAWREVPMEWMHAEKPNYFHVNQPLWVIESPRGIGVLALWRLGQIRENYGEGYFVLAEYTREGMPLSRARAALPLLPKVNPHYVMVTTPVYGPDGLTFTVAEPGPRIDSKDWKSTTYPVLREVDYLLPIGGK